MPRALFSLAFLLVTFALLTPAPATAQAVVTPQGWVGTGPVITPTPPSPPLLTTPSMSLATVSSSPVGASAATGSNVAGATASTLAGPRPAPMTVRTEAVLAQPAPPAGPSAENGAPAATNGAAAEAEARPFNGGLGRFAGAGALAAPDGRSLGDLARELAPHRTPQPGHVYTAEDIERLEEYVAVRDQRFRPEPMESPEALAAPAQDEALEEQVDGEETRLHIILEPEAPEATEQGEQPPLMAQLQPQETAQPAPPAEPAAGPRTEPTPPATLPATASPLPLVFLLALFTAAAGLAYHRRK